MSDTYPDSDFHVLGIDPGLDGALMLVNATGEEIDRFPMPTLELQMKKKKGQKKARVKRELDISGVVEIIKGIRDGVKELHVYLEKVASRPGQGVASTFKFGEQFGALRGIIITLGIDLTLVHPATWCKVMHAGISKEMEAKARSLYAIKMLFPKEKFMRTERCRVFDGGFVDARLIAEYGRREVISRRVV